jgi:hypothetical protein
VKRDTEQLLLLAFALWAWSRWKSATAVSLPSGAGIPNQGDLVQVDRVLTAMDPHGFPDLFNAALQVVENTITLDVPLSDFPKPPEPDPEYDLPARVFAMQAAFESNDGKSVYHWNADNLTTAKGMYFLNPDSDTRHKYTVFTYPLQFAVAAVDMVKRQWPDAYRAAYSGSVTAFARGLKPAGKPQFYEADEKTYREGMLARGRRFGWDAGVAGGGGRKPRLAVVKRRG